MKKRIMNQMETMAIQLACKSVGKSIPLICHKVEKPKGLEKMLEEIRKREL